MFESIIKFFKKMVGQDKAVTNSKDAAKERLHLVLMQDRANVSADFLDLMKQEIIDVIKKYIDVDENEIDVRLANKTNEDGTTGAPALYANIPILSIKEEAKKDATVTSSNKKPEEMTIKEDNKDNVEAVNSSVEIKNEENNKEEIYSENIKGIDVSTISNISKKESEYVKEENIANNNNHENKEEQINAEESIASTEKEKKEESKNTDVESKSATNTEEKGKVLPEQNNKEE